MGRSPWAAIWATLCLLLGGTAAVAPSASDDRLRDLRRELSRILDDTGWRSVSWGILAVSLENGDTLFSLGPERPLAPASNLKLVTTAAALQTLGPEFRYRTFLLADGPLRGGALAGDLVLYGTGDPGISGRSFDSRTTALESLADSLVALGVRRIEGDVVGDGSWFDGPPRAASWDPLDLNDWFAAPSTALSVNENVVTLRIEAARSDGLPPVVHTVPEGAGLRIQNRAVTGGRGRMLIGRESPERPIEIEGGIRRGGRDVWRQITVDDPNRFAASLLRHVLLRKGIRVDGRARGVQRPSASSLSSARVFAPGRPDRPSPHILATHTSPPLRNYLEVINKESHNLYADQALKTLGRVVEGSGSFQGGAHAVRRFLTRDVGLEPDGVTLFDGSGLSDRNRTSAGALTQLLGFMAHSPLWEEYRASLPEAGNPRELRRMYRSAAAGNLRAKTGTIKEVSALSGVVRSANGERIVFSILANDVPSTWAAKKVEDRIGTRLADFSRPFEVRDDWYAAARAAGSSPDPPRSLPAREPAPLTTHEVRRGESLSAIALHYGVSLRQLQEANPGIRPRSLQAGTEILIPATPAGGS